MCGRRLKIDVRPRPSGFFGKSCRAYRDRDTIFGFIYLGKISRIEKSKIQNVISEVGIETTFKKNCVKKEKSFTKLNINKNRIFVSIGPIYTV